ncbi:MAG TPA: hypothetical protein VFP91_21335 [Vicinamibacterales bacterium]|nr:hypothetical protein [Vicinamibacterales bacterium]
MKRFALCMAGVIAVSINVLAQRGAPAPPQPLEPGASQADVDKALAAAPANLKNGAMVIKWAADRQSYTTLRKANENNRLVCYDRSGFAIQQAYSVECTSVGNLDRVKQNMTVEAAAGDRTKAEAQFADLEKEGKRVKPEFGSVFYHVQGPDEARGRGHMTVAVPGATMASLGLPENGRGGGVWIMNAGTTTAHLMIPGE